MGEARFLIVNADDLGRSNGVNRGIVEAHERGIVTSASLMVRWPAAISAAAWAREHTRLSVGLHIDLGEWTYGKSGWECRYQVVAHDDPAEVHREVRRQLSTFRELLGTDPSHLDSHQHVHLEEPVRSAALSIGEELGIPVRHLTPEVHYCGDFYGQSGEGWPYPEGITVEALVRIISGLHGGVTELACHPALDVDIESMYAEERVREVATLCDQRVRSAIDLARIRPVSFRSSPAARESGV
jgi:predicted glycoside hydrolase/deacetylase ChbG (UPF0249 family)